MFSRLFAWQRMKDSNFRTPLKYAEIRVILYVFRWFLCDFMKYVEIHCKLLREKIRENFYNNYSFLFAVSLPIFSNLSLSLSTSLRRKGGTLEPSLSIFSRMLPNSVNVYHIATMGVIIVG